jgi:hypothetical protein
MNSILNHCKMRKSTGELDCEHVIDFGCDGCPYYEQRVWLGVLANEISSIIHNATIAQVDHAKTTLQAYRQENEQ